MPEAPFDGYEQWDLTPVSIPPRSTLYAVEPIGVGTPWVESLTSYITRVASAHGVFPGVLINKMIAPLVPGYSPYKRKHDLFRIGGGRSMLFNGVGLPATYTVQVLETLTLRTDLRYLTFLPLAPVLPGKAKSVVRFTKAWCPGCYEEWYETAQMLYDPLLWALQAISICPRHLCRLSTRCPYQECARPLPGVAWRSRVGYCSYCQRWLGVVPQRAKEQSPCHEDAEWQWQQWVADALGTVLALIPEVSTFPERQRVRQVVTYAVQQISAGEISAFAHAMGMSRNMIDFWHQGESVPQIDMLLCFCFRLGLSLCDFLFHELDTLHPSLKDPLSLVPVVPRKKPVLQGEDVYQALEQAAASDEQPPPTLQAVVCHIGHTSPILYRIHPTACREIVARHKTYVQQRKEARLQKFREEIRHIALKLHAHGEILSQKSIAPHLSQSGALRDPRVRTFLKEICRELENGS